MAINIYDAPDCDFWGESASGTLSALATDLSGDGTDLTVDTGVIEEASTERGDLPTRGTVVIRGQIDNTHSGTLFQFSDRELTYTTGDIDLIINGASVLTYSLANITGTEEDIWIQWSWEPNPFTSGASNRTRSELTVYLADQNIWERATVEHAQQGSATADLTFNGSAPGTDVFNGTMTGCGVFRAFHSSTELAEAISQSAAPTVAGETRLEFPVPTSDSGLGDDGWFAGPVEAMCAKALRQNDLIMAAPIVNEICAGSWAEDSTWTMTDPDDVDYTMHFEFLRRRPIPPGVNRLQFSAQVQQNGASALELGVRLYVANAPGPLVKTAQSPDDYEVYSLTATRTADDGTGTTGGAWVTASTTSRIPRDKYGYVWCWLGFDEGTLTDYRVRSWCVKPVFDLESGNGFGSGGGFGG